jgi:hypothetical protein
VGVAVEGWLYAGVAEQVLDELGTYAATFEQEGRSMKPFSRALAEEGSTVVVTADAGTSSRARIDDHECTATGLMRTGTQWTQDWLPHTENPLTKRNSRTHQDGLERRVANS